MTPQDELRLVRALNSDNISPNQELKITRALNSGEGSVDSILGKPERSIGLRTAPKFSDLDSRSESGKDTENFDYKTGAGGGLRAKLSFMETEEEKENLLKNLVGEEGYTKDSEGRLALTEAGQINQGMESVGKNLVIEDEGFSARDFADFAGLVPETVGAVGGAILGAPLIATSALGAAGGAALGQSVEESIEAMLGLQKQSLGEVAVDVAKEAALAGTLDVAGNIIIRAGKAVIGGAVRGAKSIKGGQLDEGLPGSGETVQQRGLRILSDEDAPGMPSLEAIGVNPTISRLGKISSSVDGNEKQLTRNIFYALGQKEKLLKSAGVGSVEEISEALKNAVPAKRKLLQEELLQAQKAAQDAVDSGVEVLTKATKEGADVTDDILKGLTQSYDDFQKLSKNNYDAIDDILNTFGKDVQVGTGSNARTVFQTGGEIPVFDVNVLKTKFDDIIRKEYDNNLELAPEPFQRFGQNLKETFGTKTDGSRLGFTSFKGLKSLRKDAFDTLRGKYGPVGVADSSTARYLQGIKQDMDDMLLGNVAIKYTGIGSGANALKMKEAIKLYKTAQLAYAKDIEAFAKLETLNVIRTIDDPAGLPKIEADEIIKQNVLNLTKGREGPKKVKLLLKATNRDSEEVRKTLAKAYLDDSLLRAGKDSFDPLKFSGTKFASDIENIRKSGLGKVLFENEWGKVQSLAKALSYNGINKIDDELLKKIINQSPGDDVVTTLTKVNEAKINLDKGFSASIISKLNKDALDVSDYDAAAQEILNDNIRPNEMRKILNFFKDDAQATKNIQDSVLKEILKSVDENIFIDSSAAHSLQKALNSYKPETLNLILGKEKVKGLTRLADDLVFLKDTASKGAGSLVAANIRAGIVTSPLKNFPKAARFKILNKFINDPDKMKQYLEMRVKAKTPEEIIEGTTKLLGQTIEESTGKSLPTGSQIANVAKKTGRAIEKLNRSQTAARQLGSRMLLADTGATSFNQQSRGTPVPQVKPTILSEESAFGTPTERSTPPNNRKKESLRQRAAQNPYLASTLLGGLGSASLLNRP